MKIQTYSIVFALIILPIFLVLTYYIQLQVDTITLQSEYDTKLLTATYDAMSSFEMNTANEDLSSVSDALRTIIEASNNVFMNTLSTNLGLSNASKSFVEPYIPAILYTLYDGYYIVAPTSVPEVLTSTKEDSQGVAIAVGDEGVHVVSNGSSFYTYNKDNEQVVEYSEINETVRNDYGQILFKAKDNNYYTTDPNQAILKTKTVLKSYMPYSARYSRKDESGNIIFDIVVTYTLDNYITIEGWKKVDNGKINYAKSGYLINTDNLLFDLNIDLNIDDFSERQIQEYIENGGRIIVKIGDEEIINIHDNKKSDLEDKINFLTNQIEDCELKKEEKNVIKDKINNFGFNCKVLEYKDIISYCNEEKNNLQYNLDQMSAAIYYAKGYIFSKWVQDTFGDVEEENLKNISGIIDYNIENNSFVKGNGIYDFKSKTKIFDVKGSTQSENNKYGLVEIAVDSPFYNHKLNVIRNSIQYNLNLAMTTYSHYSTFDYAMPIISDSEWEKILSNPSVVSFMQGINCGLKTYNNYMIASSNNNEISINPDNIYYVPKTNFNNESAEYHKIDCPKFSVTDEKIMAFSSKEVKYDKIYNKIKSTDHYWYDHKNLACYSCINDPNYTPITGEKDTTIFDVVDNPNLPKLRKAFYIGIAKERNNLYKPNAVKESQGYEVIYNNVLKSYTYKDSSLTANKIDYIELVFDTIPETTSNITTVSIVPNNDGLEFDIGSLNTRQTTKQTRILYVKEASKLKSNPNNNILTINDILSSFNFERSTVLNTIGNSDKLNYIKYIRVVYK